MNDNAPPESLWRGVVLKSPQRGIAKSPRCIISGSSDALTRLGAVVRLQQVDAFVVTGGQHHAL